MNVIFSPPEDEVVRPKSEIRLVQGTIAREGRVEVFIRGRWGTVCDDDATETTARVICRQLGYPDAGAQLLTRGTIRGGADPLWLDSVRCFGNETDILQCKHLGLLRHNCFHSEDLAVRCSGVCMCVCVCTVFSVCVPVCVFSVCVPVCI